MSRSCSLGMRTFRRSFTMKSCFAPCFGPSQPRCQSYLHRLYHRLRVTSESELRVVPHPFRYGLGRAVQLVAHKWVE